MASDRLLDDEDLQRLTGRRQKSRQIAWLRGEGIPFRVSATGHPVVTWLAVEGRQAAAPQPAPAPAAPQAWQPRALAEGI